MPRRGHRDRHGDQRRQGPAPGTSTTSSATCGRWWRRPHRHGGHREGHLRERLPPHGRGSRPRCAQILRASGGGGFVKDLHRLRLRQGQGRKVLRPRVPPKHDLAAHAGPHLAEGAGEGGRRRAGRSMPSSRAVRDLGTTRCGATATAAMLDEYRRRAAAEAAGGGSDAASGGKVGGGGYDEDHVEQCRRKRPVPGAEVLHGGARFRGEEGPARGRAPVADRGFSGRRGRRRAAAGARR